MDESYDADSIQIYPGGKSSIKVLEPKSISTPVFDRGVKATLEIGQISQISRRDREDSDARSVSQKPKKKEKKAPNLPRLDLMSGDMDKEDDPDLPEIFKQKMPKDQLNLIKQASIKKMEMELQLLENIGQADKQFFQKPQKLHSARSQ